MKRFDQINMVPFIDIVLVLLAIVMTTASFVSKGLIEVDLPDAQSVAALPADQEFKEISIDASSQVFYQDQLFDMPSLTGSLKELPPSTQFHLRVDKQASFESFIAVVDILKHLKLDKVAVEVLEKS